MPLQKLDAEDSLKKDLPDVVQGNALSNLTNVISPSLHSGWPDLYAGGWTPGWFNQQHGGNQWGGRLYDNLTGNFSDFEVAVGNVAADVLFQLGSANIYQRAGQAFKVGESFTPTAIWVLMSKVGNPTDNVQFEIWNDNGSGLPSAIIGSVVATVSGKRISNNSALYYETGYNWYRITGSWPALTANTVYHLVLSRSGAIDATHYYLLTCRARALYTYGKATVQNTSNVWSYNSPTLSQPLGFLIENPSAQLMLKSGGVGGLDANLTFKDCTPINQSKLLANKVSHLFRGNIFSVLVRGQSWAKDRTIADFMYGYDHDRIVLRCAATTGYATLTLMQTTGTTVTLTSTTNVSLASVVDIGIILRANNDGQDYLELWINNVKEASTSSASYNLSRNFVELGNAWVGGGFNLPATWAENLQFTALPSTLGWTYVGTATEANAFSVANSTLYQTAYGYNGNLTAAYRKTPMGLSNALGWTVVWKSRCSSITGYGTDSFNNSSEVYVSDGTKHIGVAIRPDFIMISGFTAPSTDYSIPFIGSKDTVYMLTGKGSDYYLFANGKLLVDGTGRFLATNALNAVDFGDYDVTYNSDSVWSYVKIFNGSAILPQATTGTLNEFASWSGANKFDLFGQLYNGGNPTSVCKAVGLSNNYVESLESTYELLGILCPMTLTNIKPIEVDLSSFGFGNSVSFSGTITGVISGPSAATICATCYVDTTFLHSTNPTNDTGYSSTTGVTGSTSNLTYGLHSAQIRGHTSSGATWTLSQIASGISNRYASITYKMK